MVDIKKLSNGLTVITEKMDYVYTVSIGVYVKVGSVDENEKNNGIAHLIEHMLFKGTTKRTSRQLADDMARIGGNVNAYTTKDCTSYYATTLKEHLPTTIEILFDMLHHSTIEEEALEKEKCVVMEEIDMYDDSPEDLAHEMLQKEIWKDHPLGYIISGTDENVENLSRQEILEFISKFYVAKNMVISVAGNFDEEEVFQLLEETFGTIEAGEERTQLEAPVYHKCIYTKEKDVEQVHLNIAYDCLKYDHKDKYKLSILNSILGGNINSRLFLAIREDHGLTYSIYSYGSAQTTAGLFHIYAAMNPSQVETVIDLIFVEIDNLIQNGITEDELTMTIEQIKMDLLLASESAKNRMGSNAKAIINRGYTIPIEEVLEQLNQVTVEDIVGFAKEYLVKEKASFSLVGNLQDISIDNIKKKMSFK